jgi:hypothetical protein
LGGEETGEMLIPEHLHALRAACTPPDDRPIADWCADNLNLPASYVPSGYFKPQKSRWLLPVLDALKSDRYKVVNILKPTGTGGTLCADLFVAWRVANRPGSIQWNWNSEELATTHMEERFIPLIENSDRLRALQSDNRHELRTMARRFKTGGWVRCQAATEKRLQARHIPVQVNDEVWQWDAGRMRDADARLGAFRKVGLSKQLNISQGGDVGSEWHIRCLSGEQMEHRVPCSACGHFFFPKMEEKLDGSNKVYVCKWEIKGDAIENIRIICPKCGHEMREDAKLTADWNERGQYFKINDVESETITFRWSAFISVSWQYLVGEYVAALEAKKKGATFLLRQFLQKNLAEFWDDAAEEIQPAEIITEDYKPSITWQVEHKTALTVDCQDNLNEFYLVARAWASNGESRRVLRTRCSSFDEIEQVQRANNIPSSHVLIDISFQQTTVAQECVKRIDAGKMTGWFGLKGAQDKMGLGFSYIEKEKRGSRLWGNEYLPALDIGKDGHKVDEWAAGLSPRALELYRANRLACHAFRWSNRIVFDILERLRTGRGRPWLAPAEEMNEAEEIIYKKHLGAYIFKTHDDKGRPRPEWIQISRQDHYRDCECEQIVFASMAGCLIGV